MKKHWWIPLVLLTCLSMSIMFAYRQKYTGLSLMFELLNLFEYQDEVKCKQELFNLKKTLKSDFSLQERIVGVPYWTEILPGIYSYSSYWLSSMTRTLLFTEYIDKTSLKNIKCKLHYDVKRGNAVTRIILTDSNRSKHFIYVECISHSPYVPHSISFTHNNMSSKLLQVTSEDSYLGQYIMCVHPLPPTFLDVYKVLEFIIYHSNIGVKFFIFYETGLSIKVKKLLMEIAVKDDINILLLPWNLPYWSQIGLDNPWFFDCLHRVVARNHSEFILKLGLNDFIVPQNSFNITSLKNEFTAPFVRIQEKVFCTDFKSDVIAHNLNMPFITLLKTKYFNNIRTIVGYSMVKFKKIIASSNSFLWPHDEWWGSTHHSPVIPSTSVVLHSYKECFKKYNDEIHSEDKSMWKYKDLFYQAHLYELAKESNLVIN